MAKWWVDELKVGDEVWISSPWTKDPPVQTTITKIYWPEWSKDPIQFHVKPVMSGPYRIYLFGLSGKCNTWYHFAEPSLDKCANVQAEIEEAGNVQTKTR